MVNEPFKVFDWKYNAFVNEHYHECRTIWCKILGWMIPSLWDDWDERWLKDALHYNSTGSDVLVYDKCIILESEDVLSKAPFFVHSFTVDKDYQVHDTVERVVQTLYNEIKSLEGPVIVGLYKDFDQYIGAYAGEDVPKNLVAEVPVRVMLLFPSMTRERKRVPNMDFLARTHRWVQMHLWNPQYGFSNKDTGPCFTYCYKEPLSDYTSQNIPTYSPYVRDGGLSPDKYFPCGCKWGGQCEVQFTKETPMKRLFLSMYTLNLNHPRIAHCFRNAKFKTLRTNLLPMNFEMFENCRNALISANGEYMFTFFPQVLGVVRQSSGNPKFFQQTCLDAEAEKQTLKDCNTKSGGFCEGQTSGVVGKYIQRMFGSAAFKMGIPLRAFKHYKLVLTADSLIAYGENDNDDTVVWHANFNFPKDPVLPLALMLTDEGELVILDAADDVVRGGFPKFKGTGTYDDAPTPKTLAYGADLSTRLLNLKLQMTRPEGSTGSNAEGAGGHEDQGIDALVQSTCAIPFDVVS